MSALNRLDTEEESDRLLASVEVTAALCLIPKAWVFMVPILYTQDQCSQGGSSHR